MSPVRCRGPDCVAEVGMKWQSVGGLYVDPFGNVGLLFLVLVAKLVAYEASAQDPYAVRVRAWLARRAIDAIAAIGWLVDSLFPYTNHHDAPSYVAQGREGSPVRR